MEILKNHNNLGLKILSVVIAILIWLLVTNTNDPVVTKRFSGISVNVINESALTDQGYAYSITEGDEVTVTLKGKQSIVSNLSASDITATADLSKTTKWGSVPIDITVGKYTEQLEISLGTINTMKVEMEESTTVSIPVNVVTSGDPESGYAVGITSCTPNLITVSGPKSALENAKEIVANVDISGVSTDVTKTCSPTLYDEDGKEISNNQITFGDSQISASVAIWKTKSIPVTIGYTGSPEDGYTMSSFDYEPKSITVAAPDNVLSELTSISLDDISLDGLTKDYEEDIDLTEQGILPTHVALADDTSSLKVKATIEKIITKKITVKSSELKIKNQKGYKVSYDDNRSYSITLEGANSKLKDITVDSLSPWINLNDCVGDITGKHELRIHIKDVDGVTVDSSDTVNITISN